MGDCSDGDEVGLGFGVGADGVEVDAAGEFGGGAAVNVADPFGGFRRGEVVEEEALCAAGESFVEFFARADFDFGGLGLDTFEGGADTTGGGDVIVLDEDGVVQAETVVGDTAGRGGLLFEQAETGSGLAGIEDADAGAFDSADIAGGEGGDAGEALEEVEGDAFAGEERARGTFDVGDGVAGGEMVAIVGSEFEEADAAAEVIDDRQDDGAGENEVLAGEEGTGGLGVSGDAGVGGDIARTDVFVEGAGDSFAEPDGIDYNADNASLLLLRWTS